MAEGFFNILHLPTDLSIWLIDTLHDSSFLRGFFLIPSSLVPSLSPAEHPVEWRHHRLGHRLRRLRLQFVTGGAARHAEAASLHQAASEQVPLWPRGTTTYTQPHTHTKTKSRIVWCVFFVTSSLNFSIFCIFLLQLHQYQYYSTGLLSTHDPFYEQQRHLLGPKKKKIKDEKKFKGKNNIIITE